MWSTVEVLQLRMTYGPAEKFAGAGSDIVRADVVGIVLEFVRGGQGGDVTLTSGNCIRVLARNPRTPSIPKDDWNVPVERRCLTKEG